MKKFNKWLFYTRIYLGFSLLSLLAVSVMALVNPQTIMDMVGVQLGNTDALSSIRGVYGGVGITICMSIFYLMIRHPEKGAAFLSIFWGAYAFSRLITLISDGPLGQFGSQWLLIESVMALIGFGFWMVLNFRRRQQKFILNEGL
ncbi:DUF4345 domain-containing protein [Cyclobacterium jeungdonense]|uniref:DUF4345 domain-containing protein n=1 Tax=Cyclobacterium jeungdonense TaxID=708087 RepID=A0ABT8C580_9BACT|nr:DUF4345 domain-containing protein [Cyclobacterium jeungdonense]MDN3687262.1 DUF4345 domain-containing protein [Cyclobacterium jeungdonense]